MESVTAGQNETCRKVVLVEVRQSIKFGSLRNANSANRGIKMSFLNTSLICIKFQIEVFICFEILFDFSVDLSKEVGKSVLINIPTKLLGLQEKVNKRKIKR